MNKVYRVNTDGVITYLSTRDGLRIVNNAMMGDKHLVRTMNSGYGQHYIEYKDGRVVSMVLVDEPVKIEPTKEEVAEEPRTALIARSKSGDVRGRVVTFKGKDYVVTDVTHAQRFDGRSIPAYVTYWSVRGGERFGSSRVARSDAKTGTVSHGVWHATLDALNAR